MWFSDFFKHKGGGNTSLGYAQAADLERAQAEADIARRRAGAAAVGALGSGGIPWHYGGTTATSPTVSNIPQFHVIVTYPDIHVYLWIGNEGTRLDIAEQNGTPFEDLPAKYYDLGHIAEYAAMIFSDKDVTFTLIEGLKLVDKNSTPVNKAVGR